MLFRVGFLALMAPMVMCLPRDYDRYNDIYRRDYDHELRYVYEPGGDIMNYNSYYSRNKGGSVKWDPKTGSLTRGNFDATPIEAGYGSVETNLGITGRDARLTCQFEDYVYSNVIWKKISDSYSRYADDGLDHYRMFANWNPKNGVAYLYIYDTQPSDYGTYQCIGVTKKRYDRYNRDYGSGSDTQNVAATVRFEPGRY